MEISVRGAPAFCPRCAATSTSNRGQFTPSAKFAEPNGYLAATQTRDGRIQIITSKNHYVLNLACLKQLPPAPRR